MVDVSVSLLDGVHFVLARHVHTCLSQLFKLKSLIGLEL